MTDRFERFRKGGCVRWSELSEEDKHELLTTGHPSNRPTPDIIEQDESRFRPSRFDRRGKRVGTSWICGFA